MAESDGDALLGRYTFFFDERRGLYFGATCAIDTDNPWRTGGISAG